MMVNRDGSDGIWGVWRDAEGREMGGMVTQIDG